MRFQKTLCTAVLGLVFGNYALVAGAVNLPTGDWTIYGNGYTGIFKVISVDAAGNLNATAYGNTTTGFWDASSNHILFLRQVGSALDTIQQFSGSLQSIPSVTPGSCTYVLTGTFTAFKGTGATATNNPYGWVALITAPC